MALTDITRAAVEEAIREYDRLGAAEFRRKYHFGPAIRYFLRVDGRDYDSKAIIGFAHGVQAGLRWTTDDFSGGEATVVRHLERLGFEVVGRRNPDWTRDELILACDLVASNGWRSMSAQDPRVVELSQLLQTYAFHPTTQRSHDFRNSNGVARKTADLATRHPDYAGKPTKGGKADLEVLADFLANPEEMHRQAEAIRTAILAGETAVPSLEEAVADLDLPDEGRIEGALLERLHLRRERDRGLRNRAIAAYKKKHGAVACQACGFSFAAMYGRRGEDYIECHHRLPLSESGQTITRIADLVLLCSNCHRIIHRRRPWLTFEQLVDLIRRQRSTDRSGGGGDEELVGG